MHCLLPLLDILFLVHTAAGTVAEPRQLPLDVHRCFPRESTSIPRMVFATADEDAVLPRSA